MRTRNRIVALGVGLLLLAGCGASGQSGSAAPSASGTAAQPSNAVVTVAVQADPPTLDPQKPGGPVGDNFYRNLFDTLLQQDPQGKIIPGIATKWEQLDTTTWQFTLRSGAKFTDGEPVDAAAVKFTVERILEPGKVRNLYTFGGLQGVEVVDPTTVKIITKASDPFLPTQVTDLYVLPPNATTQAGEDGFGQAPVGSGPFKLKEWVPNDHITLEANADYWAGPPAIGQLVFRPIPEASTRLAELLSGNVDLIVDLTPEQASGLDQKGDVHAVTLRSKRVPYVGMNLLPSGPKELQDVRVRQALNYGVDVPSIIQTVLQGHGYQLANIYRPDWPGYDASIQPFKRDVQKAKDLLAQAGYPNGFSITMQTSDGIISKGVEISQAIAGQLADIGVKVNVVPLDLNTYRGIVIGGQKQDKIAGLYLWNWGAKPGDPSSALTGFLKSTGVSSYWNNPSFDALVDQTLQNPDEQQRVAGYKQIQQTLMDQVPLIFLYQSEDIYGVSNRLDWSPRTDQYILGYSMKVK